MAMKSRERYIVLKLARLALCFPKRRRCGSVKLKITLLMICSLIVPISATPYVLSCKHNLKT